MMSTRNVPEGKREICRYKWVQCSRKSRVWKRLQSREGRLSSQVTCPVWNLHQRPYVILGAFVFRKEAQAYFRGFGFQGDPSCLIKDLWFFFTLVHRRAPSFDFSRGGGWRMFSFMLRLQTESQVGVWEFRWSRSALPSSWSFSARWSSLLF